MKHAVLQDDGKKRKSPATPGFLTNVLF